jgi:hypothetical protein
MIPKVHWRACCAGLVRRGTLKPMLMGTAASVAVFLIVASPYVFFLYKHTGKARFEMKSSLTWIMGQKLLSGMDPTAMESGVSGDLQKTGVYFQDRINGYIVNGDSKRAIKGVASSLLSAAKHQVVE